MLESFLGLFGVLLSPVGVEGDLGSIPAFAALYAAAILLFEPGPAFAVFPRYFFLATGLLLLDLLVFCSHAFPLVEVLFDLALQRGLLHFDEGLFGQGYLIILCRVIGKREALLIYAQGERDVVESSVGLVHHCFF